MRITKFLYFIAFMGLLPFSVIQIHAAIAGLENTALAWKESTSLLEGFFSIFLVGGMVWYLFRENSSRAVLEKEIQRQGEILKEQSRRLKAIDKIRPLMFSNILEKVQVPLTSMINLNQAIFMEKLGASNNNVKGASRIAIKKGRTLTQLVDEMRELAKLETARQTLRETSINIFDVTTKLYEYLLPEAQEKNIQLGFNYQLDKNLIIQLDANKYKKVFNKLVRCAIHCSPKLGNVIVSLEESNDKSSINLMVEDSGPGLDKNGLLNIFDSYFQAEYDYVFNEYGVIPAIVKYYAHLLGAKLSVDSKIGKGTTFELSFPKNKLIRENEAQYSPQSDNLEDSTIPAQLHNLLPPPAIQNKVEKKYRGLLIGQNENSLHYLKDSICNKYSVMFAREEKEAIEILKKYQSKIDFLIIYISDEYNDNFEIIDKLKNKYNCNRLPLIVVTDDMRASKKVRAINAGVDTYLIRPFEKVQLNESIDKLLCIKAKRDEWHSELSLSIEQQNKISHADFVWLEELDEIVLEEMGNKQFNLLELAYRLATSERQLFRKMKELTGMTPNKYIRELKLYKAKRLLEEVSFKTVAEVSYAIGFEDPHYFSKIYKKRFGKKPSNYFVKEKVK